MIEILPLDLKVDMPPLNERRYQLGNVWSRKWTVIDTHNNNSQRYKGNWMQATIVEYNLNKKYYKELIENENN